MIPVPMISGAAWKRYVQSILDSIAALAGATRIEHELTTADRTGGPTAKLPTHTAFGSLNTLVFDTNDDAAYRIFKIPSAYVGSPSFHIHWTKSTNVDESGKNVLWRIDYKVYNGTNEDGDGTSLYLEFPDTYDDTGTTTKIVHRTANQIPTGVLADYYMSIKISALTPDGTPLPNPALVSVDFSYRRKINEGN